MDEIREIPQQHVCVVHLKQTYHALSASRRIAQVHAYASDASSKTLPGMAATLSMLLLELSFVLLAMLVSTNIVGNLVVRSQHEPLVCAPAYFRCYCTLVHLAGELHPLVKVDVFYGRDRHAAVALGKPVDRRHHLNSNVQKKSSKKRREGTGGLAE